MSGSKYSKAELKEQKRRELEQKQKRKEQEQERQRLRAIEKKRQEQRKLEEERQRKAQEEKRRRQLYISRENASLRIQNLIKKILNYKSDLSWDDHAKLNSSCSRLSRAIQQSNTISDCQDIIGQIENLTSVLESLIAKKRQDDEEIKRRFTLEKQKFQLKELQRRFAKAKISSQDSLRFDRNGFERLKQEFESVIQAIHNQDPEKVKKPLERAQSYLHEHINHITHEKSIWEKNKFDSEQVVKDIECIVIGLQADESVNLWCQDIIDQIKKLIHETSQAIIKEDFSQSLPILQKAKNLEQKAIQKSKSSQIQAERRDYIIHSISRALEEMYFTVSTISDMSADNHHTSKILRATSSEGTIQVNVPFSGKVCYESEGFPVQEEVLEDGSVSSRCDDVMDVLEDMHEFLESEFDINMGEVHQDSHSPDDEDSSKISPPLRKKKRENKKIGE